jgi:acyl-coenzyme A thioesterase PaaI-like protein
VRPAIGDRLVARASALTTGRSQSVCRCAVYAQGSGGEEKLVALAQGTIARATQLDEA